MTNPTKRAYVKWDNANGADDFLQLSNPDGTIPGWIDNLGIPRGTMASGSGSGSFDALTGGINTSAAMIVGSGASLAVSGTGSIEATSIRDGSINAASYGVKADGKACFGNTDTIVITNGSSTVSCNNANFTSADIGKDIFGSSGCCGTTNQFTGVLKLTRGTILSVIDTTTVTVSTVGIAGGCTGSSCLLIWGTNDDAAWTAAENAWSNTGRCEAMIVPSGMSLIRQPHLNNPGAGCTGGAVQELNITATVRGYGPGNSIFVLEPDFDFSACIFGDGTNGCFFSFKESNIENLGLWGGGVGNTGTNSKYLINSGLGSRFFNINCTGFGGSDGALTGLKLANSNLLYSAIDGCGRTGVEVVASAISVIIDSFSANTLSHGIVVDSGAILMGNQVFYGPSGVNTFGIQVNGTYWSNEDVCFPSGGFNGTVCVEVTSTGIAYLSHGKFQNGGTISGAGIRANSGKIYLSSSIVEGGTSGGASVARAGTGTFFDLGGNTYVSSSLGITPTCVMTTGGGSSPACAAVAGSTNEKGTIRMTPGTTPGNAGTTTITLAGTYAGAINTTPSCTFTLANTGTGVWDARATTMLNVRSTTVPVFGWDNNAVDLSAASTYDVDYVCVAR